MRPVCRGKRIWFSLPHCRGEGSGAVRGQLAMKYMHTADFEVEFGSRKLEVFSGESFEAFQSGQGGSRELGRSLFMGVGRMVHPPPPGSPMAK